jgi:hypothetical protein
MNQLKEEHRVVTLTGQENFNPHRGEFHDQGDSVRK